MGVCARRANVLGASFYAWQGWSFMVLIGILIAIGLFYYNYIDMYDPSVSAARADSDVTLVAAQPSVVEVQPQPEAEAEAES